MMYHPTDDVFYTGDQDPCMVIIPPIEQFGDNTTFKAAPNGTGGSTFREH